MAGNGRARSALMRNLPKKGWLVEGNIGTYEELKIDFGESKWSLFKKDDNIAEGEYGRSQMAEVKKAAKSAGFPFDPASGSTGSNRSTGSKAKQQKAAADKKKAQVDKEPKESG